jgi:hypothetical protein
MWQQGETKQVSCDKVLGEAYHGVVMKERGLYLFIDHRRDFRTGKFSNHMIALEASTGRFVFYGILRFFPISLIMAHPDHILMNGKHAGISLARISRGVVEIVANMSYPTADGKDYKLQRLDVDGQFAVLSH